MKSILFKSKISKILIASVLSATLCACGLMSVPYITNADNNKIVNIGDSIFALSGEISNFIHSYAGKTFRRYSTSGAEVTGSNIMTSFDVYAQYAQAKADNSLIDTIFMDGGGNDILIPATLSFDPYNCKKDWWESSLSTTCKNYINDIYVDTVNLLNQMGRDGVKNIIFLGYYYCKTGTIGTTTLNPAVDYGDLKLAEAIKNATAVANYRVFLDPRKTILSTDITSDGVHPNTSGSKKLADMIWAKLKTLPY